MKERTESKENGKNKERTSYVVFTLKFVMQAPTDAIVLLKVTSPDIHGDMDCDQSNLMLAQQCYQLLFGSLGNEYLPRVSHRSYLSDNSGDNDVKPGRVYRYPGIFLTDMEIPRKPQLEDRPNSARPIIASNWTPLNEVGRIAKYVVEKGWGKADL